MASQFHINGMRRIFYSILIFFPITDFSQAQSTDGDALFNVSTIHTVNIYFTQPSFWDSLTAYYALDKPMLGSVVINGTGMDSVGIQLKGNSSYNSMPGVKKSVKISFDEFVSQKFDGLKTVNLNNGFKDPSFLREKLMNDFLNNHGIPAPRATYADVFINGIHWGFYIMVEQVNKTFLTDRFANNDGNLYKGDPHGDLRWLGSAPSLYYPNYELKTNTTANDWSGLVNLIDKINNSSTLHFYDSLESVLNTDLAVRAWAADILFANLDSYHGSGHNYYIYHDDLTGKFNWIMWDVNEAFGNFNMGMSVTQLKNLNLMWIPSPPSSRPLMNRMMQNAAYQQQYMDYLCQWTQNDFLLDSISPVIDSLVDIIRPYVYADPNKQFTNANFEWNIDHDMGNIPGIKDFIDQRRSSVVNQLAAFGCTSLSIDEPYDSNLEFSIYPVPAIDKISVHSRHSGFDKIEIINVLGNCISVKYFNESKNSVEIDLNTVKPGLYFLKITAPCGNIYSHKVVIQKE